MPDHAWSGMTEGSTGTEAPPERKMPDVRHPRRRFDKTPRTTVRRGMRTLSIRGETWSWRFARHIRIDDPQGRSHVFSLPEFSGLDWNHHERARWKGYEYAVTPGRIVDFVNRRILGYTDAEGFPGATSTRAEPAPRDTSWRAVQGPRGTWWWRPGIPDCEILSPEDVKTVHRFYLISGMDPESYIRIMLGRLESAGDPPSRLWDPRDPNNPAIVPDADTPMPTDSEVESFIHDRLAHPRGHASEEMHAI